MEFNKQYWIEQLKKEVGLMTTSYEDLDKHEVELASPTGRGSGFKVNAKEYVDKQLSIIEEQYNTFQKEQLVTTETRENLSNKLTVDQIHVPKKLEEIKPENIRFFDVNIKGQPLTIIFHDDKTQTAVDNLNLIGDRRFFIKERKREDMTGLETLISVYQYIAAIADIPREQQDLSAFEKITQNMDTVFDGLKMKGII